MWAVRGAGYAGTRGGFALLTLMLLMLAGPAAGQGFGIQNPQTTTPTTMYFHLDANQDFPINTQPPDDRFARANDIGLLGLTSSCVPDPTGQFGMVSQRFHTLYGFSTPGYVEYGFTEQGGPRIHPERGLAKDVRLDTEAPATLHWFLQTQVFGDNQVTPSDVENAPVVIPQVTVQATIREGDEVGVGDTAYNAGLLIASGLSEPMLVAPDPANPHYHQLSNGRNLYEFVVPLQFEQGVIPKDEAFNIRIDVFVSAPGCDADPDQTVMPSGLRIHTSPEFRPRLEWSIVNPLEIEFIHPQFVGDALVIHTAMSSPWGNYDVDESPGGIQVTIEGPSAARSLVRTAFVQRHHEHNHHFKPVDVTFSWPFLLDGAREGDYTIQVWARNDQGTAEAVGRAGFVLGPNVGIDSDGKMVERVQRPEAVDTPAPGLLPVMMALGALGWLAGRRRAAP